MTPSFISFRNVSKRYGSVTVVDNLNLDIEKGEFVSLLGPSGSGKTTILMMLAGFEGTSAGEVSVGGHRIDMLPPHKRNMGVVFQNYALFPHRTVAENVAFPLKMRGMGRAEIREKVARALDMVQLSAMAGRKPGQLSGGQQQRVSLARALVFEPEVVLMDEPLGALDKQLREQMQLDIRALHQRLGLTIVFVTHDQGEALTMSDRVAVFNRGKIEQIAPPAEIYDHPKSDFVAQFIGETNLLAGHYDRGTDPAVFTAESGLKLHIDPRHPRLGDGMVSIRPERLRLGAAAGPENRFTARVEDIVYHGDHLRVSLRTGTQALIARAERSVAPPQIGSEIAVSVLPADAWSISHEA